MSNSSYVIVEDGGRQNIYANEPRIYRDPEYTSHLNAAELANARWAMIGFIAAIGAYATTGQLIPGIF